MSDDETGHWERPASFDRGTTHWDGCWQFNDHHACALAKIEDLQRAMNALRVRTGTTEDWVLP